ncbi:DUF3850 domain-containing protein [Serratia marcescens]|uniref:DUF3850 domain-containing protein n=1 Tax=Serratia marcescens TaxID=615 RepID=A0A5C7CDW6_SERMA|nr:DUF3850 domain-containing protein [Serratia marcescens]TXE33232.1 DUF3850 domain-containing protein [Serratia marcescens]TXE65244.1 DUF3850 domain-containing protein [Serratia marcescens]
MKKHHLKIHPAHFSAVASGKKKAEFRINDRNFAVGDLLRLQLSGECPKFMHPDAFANAHIWVRITHITDLAEWAPGYVMLSIERGPFKC